MWYFRRWAGSCSLSVCLSPCLCLCLSLHIAIYNYKVSYNQWVISLSCVAKCYLMPMQWMWTVVVWMATKDRSSPHGRSTVSGGFNELMECRCLCFLRGAYLVESIDIYVCIWIYVYVYEYITIYERHAYIYILYIYITSENAVIPRFDQI